MNNITAIANMLSAAQRHISEGDAKLGVNLLGMASDRIVAELAQRSMSHFGSEFTHAGYTLPLTPAALALSIHHILVAEVLTKGGDATEAAETLIAMLGSDALSPDGVEILQGMLEHICISAQEWLDAGGSLELSRLPITRH